ncbi:MAG TPA: two-component regulator propeller domain-containing protein, partial [Candidatus Binatia bacterium]|nr:two-component regulator propeller domain-containing protein [Candidatus Binatia bacterium]
MLEKKATKSAFCWIVLRTLSILVFGWLIWADIPCFAAPRTYRFEQWNTERGLPQNTVLSIVQSHDGYLWIGTRFGFTRFDGATFTTFSLANTPDMPCENCYAMAEDNEGSLWIGTNKGLIRRKNNRLNLFTKEHGLTSKSVRRICQGPSGALWIGTGRGLGRFLNGTFTNLIHDVGVITDRAEIFEDRSGCVWFNTQDAIFRWPAHPIGRPEVVVNRENYDNDRVRFFLQDSKDRIWFGNAAGLFCWCSNRLEHFVPDISAELGTRSPTLVQVAFETAPNELWVTVSEKNILYRFFDGKFHLFNGPQDKPIEWVTTGLRDREGTIWIGTRFSGLIAVQPVIATALCARDGLGEDNVLSVCDGRDGSLWVGTSGGTVCRVRGEAIESFAIPDAASWDAVSVFEDAAGTVWVGTRKGDPHRSLLRLR